MEKPDIFDYSDFRIYLEDLFEYKNSVNPRFTKAYVCRGLGQANSRSFFHGILNGRFLSPVKLPLMVETFEMEKAEAKYFRVLVNFNQAFDDPDERDLYFDQLLTLKRSEGKEVEQDKYEYYRKWYHPAIRSLLNIVNVKSDPITIKNHLIPAISAQEIRESLKLLEDLELIAPDEEGYLRPSEKSIRTPQYCKDEIVLTYQKKVLEQAMLINPQPQISEESELRKRTLTKLLTFSQAAHDKINDAITKFNNEINAIVSEDSEEADRLYQMVVSLFPYAKGVSK